jgi:UPF0176 protein
VEEMIDYEKKNGFYTFTFYKCIPISNPSALRQRIRKQAANLQIIGTIMLTEEGINSTISSISLENLNKMITLLKKRFGKIEFRKSFSENKPFKRLKVKVRKEIVTSGTKVSLEKKSSNYVKPENWDDFIKLKWEHLAILFLQKLKILENLIVLLKVQEIILKTRN